MILKWEKTEEGYISKGEHYTYKIKYKYERTWALHRDDYYIGKFKELESAKKVSELIEHG